MTNFMIAMSSLYKIHLHFAAGVLSVREIRTRQIEATLLEHRHIYHHNVVYGLVSSAAKSSSTHKYSALDYMHIRRTRNKRESMVWQ